MYIKNLKIFRYTLSILCVFLLSICLTSVRAEPLDSFLANQTGGKPLEQLAKEYWTWLVKQPPSENVSKLTGQNPNTCLTGFDSTNKTIFLYNSYGKPTNFKCTIDSTKSILVPLLVGEADETVGEDKAKLRTLQGQWESARIADEYLRAWDVMLDGKVLFKKWQNEEEVNSQLKDKILIRNSTQFLIHYPVDNNRYSMGIKDLKSENNTFPAVVDGYYLHLKPLPVGEHNLTYTVVHFPLEAILAGGTPAPIPWTTTYKFTVR
jgi:hypothetical protein